MRPLHPLDILARAYVHLASGPGPTSLVKSTMISATFTQSLRICLYLPLNFLLLATLLQFSMLIWRLPKMTVYSHRLDRG